MGKRYDGPWWAYWLVGTDGVPFYVGLTVNPAQRATSHRTKPGCAGYGREWRMELLAAFFDKYDGAAFEYEMIRDTPGLVNVVRRRPLSGRPTWRELAVMNGRISA